MTWLRDIKVIFLDSDGVMFPNTVLNGAPYKAKFRSYYDGQGISLARDIGIRVVFITAEKGESAAALREAVAKLNGLPSSQPQLADGWPPVVLYEGRGGVRKLEAAREFLAEAGLTMADAAFMGDDVVDLPLLREVGLACCPAQAEDVVRRMCPFVARREGGAGAIRDLVNAILGARGIDPATLRFA